MKNKVQSLLKILNHSINQLQQGKQIEHKARLSRILNKYPKETEESMAKLADQLQLRVKFLKLSYPNINFDPENKVQIKEQTYHLSEHLPYNKTLANSIQVEVQTPQRPAEPVFKSPKGKFIVKDGQLVEGQAETRKEVDLSNWYVGNADPQQLQRHKQLLDRQYFRGPTWQDKPVPVPGAVQFLQYFKQYGKVPYQMKVQPEDQDKIRSEINGGKPVEQSWVKIKR